MGYATPSIRIPDEKAGPMHTVSTTAGTDVLIEVKDLAVEFHLLDGTVPAVNGVNLEIKRGKTRAVAMLERVGMPEPQRIVDTYPHQLSGGMLQRSMIALALSCNPDLLIADEPTTALDVTTSAQILDLMQELQQDLGMAIMYITHDLGVIAEMADEVVVMYLGRVVEHADVITL